MAKWKQMKMIVGSIMVGALLMPTMSITARANAETEVTVDNFESEILPNLAIKEDGTPLKVAITVAELDSEYVIAVQKYAQYLLETAGAEVTVSVPWCASMIRLERERPSPVPSCLVVWNA